MPALLTSTSSRPNSVSGLVDEAFEILAVGDVDGTCDGAATVVADVVCEFVETILPARAQDDGGAAFGQQPCRRLCRCRYSPR